MKKEEMKLVYDIEDRKFIQGAAALIGAALCVAEVDPPLSEAELADEAVTVAEAILMEINRRYPRT